MAETTLTPPVSKRKFDPRAWLASNPVILKELRGRMRGGRAFLLLTLYLFFMSAIIGLIYLAFLASNVNNVSVDMRQSVGKTLFSITILLELFTACFVAPALTAGAISAEREGQTFDLLRTTLLSEQALVLGKLNSSFLFLLLLLFASLPLLSIASIFGGVTTSEILIGIVLLITTTLMFSAVGVFFSSFTKRTLISTVLSYSFTLMVVFGIPAFLLATTIFFSAMSSGSGGMSRFTEVVFIIMIYLMIMLNPIGTAIATELLLIEGAPFYYNMQYPSSSGTFFILSPWIGYTVVFFGISLLLIGLSIFFVRQREK
jgi:ABC-type transport system involved in multi-copper enzyme maturation permease subunit